VEGETDQLISSYSSRKKIRVSFEMDRFFTLKRLGQSMVRNAVEGDLADVDRK
jgi:hypothetical protein